MKKTGERELQFLLLSPMVDSFKLCRLPDMRNRKMQDFQKYAIDEKDRTEPTEIRVDKKTGELLEEASYVLGVSKSDFISTVLHKAANSVVEKTSGRVLSPEDAETFVKAITSDPGEPSPHSVEMARLYRERVVHVDE